LILALFRQSLQGSRIYETTENIGDKALFAKMGVSTGTICPFPFTTVNISQPPQDVAECTVTYAEAIGPLYEAFRGLLLGMASLGILVMIYRLYQFSLYTARLNVRMVDHPMSRMIVLALFFNVSLLVSSVDMFAFNGIYPAELFVILDEFNASSALSNAVFTVDLYHTLAKSLRDKYRRQSIIARNVTLVAIWTNFVGFIILGVLDSSRYYLYEGLKCIIGSLILYGFIVSSSFYVNELIKVLRRGLELQANKTRGQNQIAILKRKHTRFLMVVGLAAVALTATGILALSAETQSWALKIENMPDAAQLVLRLVYVAYIFLQFYLFRVPKSEISSSSANSAGKDTNDSAATAPIVQTGSLTAMSNPPHHGNQIAHASSLVVSEGATD